jgi:hypothetical protein
MAHTLVAERSQLRGKWLIFLGMLVEAGVTGRGRACPTVASLPDVGWFHWFLAMNESENESTAGRDQDTAH